MDDSLFLLKTGLAILAIVVLLMAATSWRVARIRAAAASSARMHLLLSQAEHRERLMVSYIYTLQGHLLASGMEPPPWPATTHPVDIPDTPAPPARP